MGGHDTLVRFLDDAGSSDETVLLLVNDGHRSTQTRPALEIMAELGKTLPRMPRFRAIVATGTHRFEKNERSEFERSTFGGYGLRIDQVAWHDALDEDALVGIAGARMHRWLGESRFLLPIGSVEPHYFAGVTGPHKTLTVGCMSHEDIERNHAHAMHQASGVLRLSGNPVYDDIARTVRGLESAGKVIRAIAQVVRGDKIVAAAVGSVLDTVEALMPEVRRLYGLGVTRAVDVLHLKVPLPLGRNLYQADKALKNNHRAVRDGGGIVLDADCFEGIGPDAFLSLLRRAATWEDALRIVEKEGYRLGDHKAVMLLHLTDPACRGVHLALVSSHVRAEDAKAAGMTVHTTVEEALVRLVGLVDGSFEHGLAIEDAGMVCVTPDH